MHEIVVEEEEEEMYTENHEDIITLPTKNVLTVMGDHLYGSSINDGIYATQFHYDGVHTVWTDFDEDVLITMGKNWDEEDNDSFHNIFHS